MAKDEGDVLLAIDPGMNSPGIAVFGASGLVHAERVRIPAEWAGREDGDRWLRVANEIAARALAYSIDAVIFERPQWYAAAKSKGDPNQLAGVAAVASCATGIIQAVRCTGIEVFSPKPAEWVGQLSKKCTTCKANKKTCPACHGSAWETPRGRRIRSRLTPAELALCPDQNDAIDAVGLGLWKIGRFTPKSVLSNGRDGR